MTPVSADINNPGDLKRALRGAGTVVAVGRLGALPKVREAGPAEGSRGSGGGSGQAGGTTQGM